MPEKKSPVEKHAANSAEQMLAISRRLRNNTSKKLNPINKKEGNDVNYRLLVNRDSQESTESRPNVIGANVSEIMGSGIKRILDDSFTLESDDTVSGRINNAKYLAYALASLMAGFSQYQIFDNYANSQQALLDAANLISNQASDSIGDYDLTIQNLRSVLTSIENKIGGIIGDLTYGDSSLKVNYILATFTTIMPLCAAVYRKIQTSQYARDRVGGLVNQFHGSGLDKFKYETTRGETPKEIINLRKDDNSLSITNRNQEEAREKTSLPIRNAIHSMLSPPGEIQKLAQRFSNAPQEFSRSFFPENKKSQWKQEAEFTIITLANLLDYTLCAPNSKLDLQEKNKIENQSWNSNLTVSCCSDETNGYKISLRQTHISKDASEPHEIKLTISDVSSDDLKRKTFLVQVNLEKGDHGGYSCEKKLYIKDIIENLDFEEPAIGSMTSREIMSLITLQIKILCEKYGVSLTTGLKDRI